MVTYDELPKITNTYWRTPLLSLLSPSLLSSLAGHHTAAPSPSTQPAAGIFKGINGRSVLGEEEASWGGE